MKMHLAVGIRAVLIVLGVVCIACLITPGVVQGQSNYFYGSTANGNWDTTSALWSTPTYSTSGLVPWVNSNINPNTAYLDTGTAFPPATRTLTLTQDITAQSVLFDARSTATSQFGYTQSYDLAGTNTLNLASGTLTFNFLAGNTADVINAQIDANLSTPGDLTVNVAGTDLQAGAFGDTTLTLTGVTTFNNLNIYGGYLGLGSTRIGANAVFIDHNSTIGGTVNLFGYDGQNIDGASFAVGTTSSNAVTVSANNFVINPNNVHGASYIRSDFIARIGASNSGTTINELDVNGVISGNGDLMFAAGFSGGGGLVVLNQHNTYLGFTMFNAGASSSSGLGVLQLGIDNAIPTGSPLIWGFNTNGNGGTLDLNGHNQTVSSLWTQFGAGSSVITNNEPTGLTTSTLTISGSDSPGAFALPINDGASGGKIALVRSGAGTTVLTNASSTYSGGTSILGGVLSISADHVLGAVPSNATSGSLIVNGGTLAMTGVGFTLSSNRGIALGPAVGSGAGTINVTGNGNLTYNGIIDNGGPLGTGGLTLSGAGTLTLGGANTYTGPTAINQGTLSLATGGSLHALSTVTIATGATLAGTGTANGSVIVNGAIAPGSTTQVGQLNVGSLTLSGGGAYNWKLFNAPGAAGNDWDLISVGAGIGAVTLNNTQANPFIINVTAPPGGLINFVDTQSYTWQILSAGSFVGGPYNSNLFNVNTSAFPAGDSGSTITLSNSGGNLSLVYTPGPTPLIWKGGPGNWSNDAGATDWTGGPWTPGSAAAFNSGSGTVTLQAPISAAGLQFNTGGYTIDGSGANTITSPGFSVTNGGDTVTISAQIVGTNLTMRGTGTLILTGPNTYTGTTTIASGTLQGNTTSLPTDVINNGSLVFAQAANGTFSHNLSGSGTIVVQNQNNSVLTLGGTNTSTSFVKINSGVVSVDSDARLGNSSSVMLNGGTLRTSTGFNTTRTINVGDPAVLSPANGTLDTMGNTVVLSGGNSLAPQVVLNNTSAFHKVGTGELQVTTSGFTYGGNLNTSGLVEVDQGTLTVGIKSGTGSSTSNPATFFGPTGFSNGLALMDGTTFADAASTTGNASFNSLSSLSVTGSATFQIYRSNTLDSGLSQSPSLTIDGNRATPLTLHGTLTVNGNGNLSGTTPRLSVGALTLTGDSTLQMVTNVLSQPGGTGGPKTYSTNFTESGLIVDNGHTLTFGAGGNSTNNPGSGIFLNAVAGNNVVTGNWIIGNPAGTNGVTVSVGGGDNLSFTSGSITVNPFGQLSLFQGFTYGTIGQTLTLNGIGAAKATFAGGTAGALLTASGKNSTYIGNVALASDSIINVPGTSASPPVGSLKLTGTISGPGLLQKQGTGNLIIDGVNTGSENVLVGNGTVTVGDGSSVGFGTAVMPMGNLTLGEQPTTDSVSSTTGFTVVNFRNEAQTIGNLASSFAASSGTISQTVMLTGTDLGGTVLTINETGATTFGPGAVSTLTSKITGLGSIVLGSASSGTLTFTGTNNYNGGTTINGGKLALAGGTNVGAIYGGDVAINANGILGVNATANLVVGNPTPPTGGNTTATAVINSGGTMSIDTNFDASVLVDLTSVGILALNTNNSTLSGTSGSSAFIGAFGAESLTSAMLAPGAGNTYRLGGRGGTLTVSNGVLTDSAGPVSNSLIVGSIQPNGSGTVILAAVNTFSGGTTVNNGTLQTTADGALGSGGLAVNAASAAVSLASLQSNEMVSSLSSAISGGGTGNLTIAAGKTLTDNQSTSTTFQGTVSLTNGATAHSGGTLTKSGSGILEVDGAPSLGPNSNINVNAGKLKFNVNSGSVFVGTGVLATVTGTANLELAGSVSALDPLLLKGRADILNNSTAAAGVLVSGTHQQVGSIDGAGTTQVSAGSDLTANHIVQGSLIIGGTSGNPGRVTIDASDSNGNPLASSEATRGFAIAGSVFVGGPFDSGSTDPVLATEAVQSGNSVAAQLGTGGSSSVGGNLMTVPEPSSILLAAVGALALGLVAGQKRLLKSRP